MVADGNRHAVTDNSPFRPYKAIVWTDDPERAGQRSEVMARGLDEARSLIKAQFDEPITITLWNEEDSEKPRSG